MLFYTTLGKHKIMFIVDSFHSVRTRLSVFMRYISNQGVIEVQRLGMNILHVKAPDFKCFNEVIHVSNFFIAPVK